MNLKNAFAAAWNAVGNVIYYPSKWNPLVGQPKRLDELNFLEMMFIGVRRQTILKPGFATMAGAGVAASGLDDTDLDAHVDFARENVKFDEQDSSQPGVWNGVFDDHFPTVSSTGCYAYNHTLDPSNN